MQNVREFLCSCFVSFDQPVFEQLRGPGVVFLGVGVGKLSAGVLQLFGRQRYC